MPELTWQGKYPVNHLNASTASTPLHTPYALSTIARFGEQQEREHLTPITPNWHNRLIYGDTGHILPALLTEFSDTINLIYIDPPFMTGRDFMSGDQKAYSDKWGAHGGNLDMYISWLYEVFCGLYFLLAQNGSLYVHLDWRVVHYARVILDEIFGFSPNAEGPGFKSEIIWHYQSGGRSHRYYARKHDTILLYTRSANYCFHGERIGERRGTHKRNHMRKLIGDDGRVNWTIRSGGRVYSYSEDTQMTPGDVWTDISHLHQKDPERNGYATQKPAALLERIILASSEQDDLILDCFCGSGVTPSVAEQSGRRWIACDQSPLAIQRTQERLLRHESPAPFMLQHVLSTTESGG